jgi:Xaa-Pro dipeptidase
MTRMNELGKHRIARLQAGMHTHGVDAMVCLKPENTFYLSGFNPIIYSHPVVAILPAVGEPVILVHALRDDHARASAWPRDIRLYGAWSTKKTMGPNWLAALHEILAERGLASGTLGIEADWLPLARMEQIRTTLPQARFEDVSPLIEHTRLVKDAHEIADARIAAQLADIGMDAALAALRRRASEREVAIEAQAAMNRAWLEQYPGIEVCDFGSLEGGAHNGLWCWCLTGERVSINTDNPSLRVPADGEIAVVFIWANCNGMHAENERAVAIGALPPPRQAAFDAVLEIRSHAVEMLRPCVRCADVYARAREAYARLGYERYLPGRIGHGLGLGAHEHPSLDPRSDVVLQPGMLVTFEPNLRIPEWGGLQHSDSVLITDTGCEFLTHTERGLLQV